MSDANDELAKLLEDDKKNELAEEVLFRDILAWLSLWCFIHSTVSVFVRGHSSAIVKEKLLSEASGPSYSKVYEYLNDFVGMIHLA